MKNGVLFKRSQINQLLCALAVSYPAFIYGLAIGWMSPMSLLLQSEDSPRGELLSDSEISLMASLPYLVSIPLYYVVAYIGDNYGRKIAYLWISAVGSIIWILKLCSTNSWILILARCLVSVSMAGSFVTCPVYIKEISENSIRGTLGCCTIILFTMGGLFAFIIGDLLSYQVILLLSLSMSLLSFPLFFFLPETPSYLVQNSRVEDAQKVLCWLRRKNPADRSIQEEIMLIQIEQKNDEAVIGKKIIKTIVSDKILFKAFQISLIAVLSREFCGAVPVMNFAGTIFAQASNSSKLMLNPNQQAMVLGVVQLVGSIVASSIVEKSGRKLLLFTTSLISGISMFLLATWFLLKNNDIVAPAWIPILTLCICILCDAAGLLPLGVVIVGEIFSFKYRGIVLGITLAIASLLDFVQLMIFKHMSHLIGVESSFYSFSIMCLLTSLYVIFCVPETKERHLDEIYNDLRGKRNDAIKGADRESNCK
ncbi:unnamed protein product [Leptidea sinapis]|uniref:Major facilitator superfamily (MFS) profile domain-containing protein n=1 Tax=Leptidea sinapis TaxID=189913 RepID=A0A5E4QSR0_9NEOP|nr:unnamed protein product [Leptidea sinapis]